MLSSGAAPEDDSQRRSLKTLPPVPMSFSHLEELIAPEESRID